MVNFTLRKLLGMIPMLLIITFLIYAGIECPVMSLTS